MVEDALVDPVQRQPEHRIVGVLVNGDVAFNQLSGQEQTLNGEIGVLIRGILVDVGGPSGAGTGMTSATAAFPARLTLLTTAHCCFPRLKM